MKFYELPAVNDARQSFYGKAHVIEKDGEKILLSYETEVCKIDRQGNFIKLWDGYSQTTMRHINSFLYLFDIKGGGKAWWDKLEVGEVMECI